TSFSWVWDVYDSDKRRALRVTGEEAAVSARRGRDARASNAWASADDQVLRGISRAGMERIASFLNAPDQAPGSAPTPTFPPGPPLPTLVSSQDDSPEAAGIFRMFGGSSQPAQPAAEPQAEPAKTEAPKASKPVPTATTKGRQAALNPATRSAALEQ